MQNTPIEIDYRCPNSLYVMAEDSNGSILVLHVDNSCGEAVVSTWSEPKETCKFKGTCGMPIKGTEYEFEFNFYNNDEPRYILHNVDYFDSTMLHMLIEFKVDIANIKDWKITKL